MEDWLWFQVHSRDILQCKCLHINKKERKNQLLWVHIYSVDKTRVMCLLLHSADVSHPTKTWDLHKEWTARCMEEFFNQGDREKEMGLDVSPLCDRNTTQVPQSQIGKHWQMVQYEPSHEINEHKCYAISERSFLKSTFVRIYWLYFDTTV